MQKLLLLLALALSLADPGESFPTEDGVLVLDPSNFQAAVREFPNLMVEFYAPWCPYCQVFGPKYANVASQLAARKSSVKLAKMDADKYPGYAGRHGVEEYPTVKYFQGGSSVVYDGELEVIPMVQWLMRSSRTADGAEKVEEDPVLELNEDNFYTAIRVNPLLMVEFYAPWCPHCQELAPKYSGAARELAGRNSNIRLAKVDATRERQLAADQGIHGYPTLKFYRYGSPLVYDGPRQQQSIVRWLLEAAKINPFVQQDKPHKIVHRAAADDAGGPATQPSTSSSDQALPVLLNLLAMVAIAVTLA